jgi:2'-5' RNA ligase
MSETSSSAVLLRRSRVAYSYGCLMANLPDDVAARVRGFAALIPDDDLYDDGSGEHGREEDPHITVKYGLHTDDGGKVAEKLQGREVAYATLGRMSVFENEKFTVLKVDIASDCLHKLNTFISETFAHTDSFPVYHPHVTIAYLRKGVDWRKYACDLFQGMSVTFDTLVYSTADDVDTTIILAAPQLAVARVANKVANHWIERNNIADQFPDHKTEIQVKIQLAYDGDEHAAQQAFMDKIAQLGARKVEIVSGAVNTEGFGEN